MIKKIIGGFLVMALAVVAAFNITLNTESNEKPVLTLANVEALAQSEEGSDKWFSNLNWVECPISKLNTVVGFYYKGILIPVGAWYTVYGNKKECERELTTNECNTSHQTPCEERDS